MPSNHNGESIIYFPGRWQNSKDWAIERPEDDVRFFLLNEGYQIFTIDYRMNYQNRGINYENEVRLLKLSDIVDDSHYVINFLYLNLKVEKAFFMGFSMGAAQIFLLDQDKHKIKTKGIIALDGGIKQKEAKKSQIIKKEFDKEDILIMNPSWDKNFRERYINVLRHYHIEKKDNLINVNQIRLLLNGEKWWPKNIINEMKMVSVRCVHKNKNLDGHLYKIECPILCVMTLNNNEYSSHRTYCTAIETSSDNISTICLKGWSHLETLCHPEVHQYVLEPIQSWLAKER